MYKYATAIGIDIGRTLVRTALVRLDGKVFGTYEFPFDSKIDRDTLTNKVIEAVKVTRLKSVNLEINPLCVGVSAKGFIDRQKGIVIGPDQGVSGWTDVPVAEILQNEVGLPAYVDNDANLMAVAETTYGAASGYGNIIFVTLRSGIGGAIIIDGKLYRGDDNAAGEFGQMSINCDGPVSSTGIKGSLEHLASSGSLVRTYLKLCGLDKKGSVLKPDNFRAKDVFELYYKGDTHATKAVHENARFIGSGLANIVSIFSPQIIILGGGMSQAGGDYLKLIRERTHNSSLHQHTKKVLIERASLGQSASTMGASLYALTRLDGKDI